MADSTPISFSRDSSTNLKTLVDPPNSDSPAFDSARRNETLDSRNTKNVDLVLTDVVEEPLSALQFLRKLLFEELGNDRGRDYELIVIAIHAVLLESGFVGFDPIANRVIEGFHFHETWPPLFYTRPELVTAAQGKAIVSIVLKFQTIGKYVDVYGSVGLGVFDRVCLTRLDEDQLVPPLNVVWANCSVNEDTSAGKEVLKFWRDLKDNLVLPLWIDIYEKVGFDLPPCFMKLPNDLKLKILEKIRGVEVAKLSCVCSELNVLAQSDDLWKLKCEERFSLGTDDFQGSWKKTFARKQEKMNAMRKSALTGNSLSLMDKDIQEEGREIIRMVKRELLFSSINLYNPADYPE